MHKRVDFNRGTETSAESNRDVRGESIPPGRRRPRRSSSSQQQRAVKAVPVRGLALPPRFSRLRAALREMLLLLLLHLTRGLYTRRREYRGGPRTRGAMSLCACRLFWGALFRVGGVSSGSEVAGCAVFCVFFGRADDFCGKLVVIYFHSAG